MAPSRYGGISGGRIPRSRGAPLPSANAFRRALSRVFLLACTVLGIYLLISLAVSRGRRCNPGLSVLELKKQLGRLKLQVKEQQKRLLEVDILNQQLAEELHKENPNAHEQIAKLRHGEVPLLVEELCRQQEEHQRCTPLLAEGVTQEDEDPWETVKWVGRPAACKVKGLPIEEIDIKYNMRRGFALDFTQDVEDKTHLLPWLLAAHDGGKLASRRRRVFIDLGASYFNTSVTWFMHWYPLDFTEIHAFEAVKGLFTVPWPGSFHNQTLFTSDGSSPRLTQSSKVRSVAGARRPGLPFPLPNWLLRRISYHQTRVGVKSRSYWHSVPQVDITHMIQRELHLTRDDAVVVKMDIEGEEWNVLPQWLDDPQMVEIVDELFVEIHYKHMSMERFQWGTFNKTRAQAVALLEALRAKGFYAHYWP